jgi:endonuclease/exonuclease/phosphatase family metal-dependent hydrolase
MPSRAVILSWNVAGRVRASQERQIDALRGCRFDVLCLQEVTPTTRSRWEVALSDQGFEVAVSEWPVPPTGLRRLAVLIAARAPLRQVEVPGLPWPERHLAGRVSLAGTEVEVHNLHAPLSSKAEQVKVRTLEAVFAALTRDDRTPRALAGDINTPRYESREGEVSSFARTRGGRLRPALGERHDRAELAIVAGLPARGWQDAFRAVHGYARRDRSWVAAWGEAYRLDHVIVSPPLRPVACEYVHTWRERGLSDHAAIWAELEADAPA